MTSFLNHNTRVQGTKKPPQKAGNNATSNASGGRGSWGGLKLSPRKLSQGSLWKELLAADQASQCSTPLQAAGPGGTETPSP